MSGPRFRQSPTYASGADNFSLDVSQDGKVFTLTFSDLQAALDGNGAATQVAARVFSLVLPVDGGGHGVDIAFRASGFAVTTEGTAAHAVLSVNGQTAVEQFRSETERDFIQELRYAAGPICECGLVVSVLTERDPQHPGAAAHLNVLSVDAEIISAEPGRFVLSSAGGDNFTFTLVAPDGGTLATGESHQTRAAALHAIESAKRHAPTATLDDQTAT